MHSTGTSMDSDKSTISKVSDRSFTMMVYEENIWKHKEIKNKFV